MSTPPDIIDLPEVMERLQNDSNLLLELLHDFENDFRKKRKLIDQVMPKFDWTKLQEVVHSLKGAAGNISAKTIHSSCMLIEYLITVEDMALIKEVLQDIDRQFAELQTYAVLYKKECRQG